jgi:energy-coupling factor transporter ATP-binding protein EcfA2
MAVPASSPTRTGRTASNDPTPCAQRAVTIERIHIEGLFGLYDYVIPGPHGALSRTPILYGENGLGKTNILRVLFHLLSPAERAGHRTALGRIKFRRVDVALSNSVSVRAQRTGQSIDGAMRLEVVDRAGSKEKLLGTWDWFPGDASAGASHRLFAGLNAEVAKVGTGGLSRTEARKQIELAFSNLLEHERNPLIGEAAWLNALRANVPPVYFLSADRMLSSDNVEREDYLPFPTDSRRLRPEEMVARGREHALNEAIALASRRFSQIGVRAARKGSGSTHTIYRELLRRLASRRSKKAPATARLQEDLTSRLRDLSLQYQQYSQYGLAPVLDGESLVAHLENVRPAERSVAAEILRPYVESLTETARDLGAAYAVIDTFVSVVNGFLYHKRLEFAVAEGLAVRNLSGQALEPKDLSSGEQQLLLLFCHIALAHAQGGLFIIDEPELSLNVKWQRRLIDALLKLDAAKNLQFVMASHSLEILTKHRSDVVPLRDTVNV